MADTCPNCGATGVESDSCPTCGFVISVERRHLAETARPSDARPLYFRGRGGELFGIWIVCAFLTLSTLGAYSFWAKTRIRRYLYAHTEIEGDRLAYHGTGAELLIGFLKATGLFIVPIVVLSNAPELLDLGPVATALAGLGAAVLGAIFAPLAIVGARRYRLSRTSWRGIRFSFRGDVRTFIARFIGWSVLTGLTVGVYYPVFLVRKQAFLTSHSYFGTARFDFTGEPRGLMTPYVRLLGSLVLFLVAVAFVAVSPAAVVLPLAAAILVAVAWFRFLAHKRRFFWNHTRVQGATFRCSVTGGGLARLYLGNAALLLLTLGLATPWVRARSAEFMCRHLALDGAIDLDAIAQEAQAAPATGEGLSTFFDTDIGIG